MISKLAKSQIDKFLSEGLKPSFEDYIVLNNLGLQVERGSEMYSFSATPRISFLGDIILRQPTVAKTLWIDNVKHLFNESFETSIYIYAYACATPDDELPSLNDLKEIEKHVINFRDNVLIKFTDYQIICAIDWIMNGMKPDLSLVENPEEKKSLQEVFDIPSESCSYAKQILMQACLEKISPDVAKFALLEDLEKMILISAMNNSEGITKNEHVKAAGRFYVAAGKINTRLHKEKEALNGK